MVNNKVIRRQGYSLANGYERLSADLIELFGTFDDVSIEKSTVGEDGTGTVQTKIFLDKNKKLYLLIVPNTSNIVRISIHCGEGTKEGENWAYIDLRPNKNEKLSYSFARTAYGAVFSVLPNVTDNKVSLSDGYLQNFFTKFETSDGKTVNGLIFCSLSKDEPGSSITMSYIVTEEHDTLESLDFSKCFLGNLANQTVLVNAVSYAKPLICNNLYKKIMSEESKFGRIRLNNRTFISGSHFCLEGEEE